MGRSIAPAAHEESLDSGFASSDGECRHFQSVTEQLPFELTVAFLPLRRCMLAERMVRLLIEADSAQQAHRFLLEPDSDGFNCRCGPDRGSISRVQCTIARCDTSCHPAYEAILDHAGVRDIDESGCDAPTAVEG